MDFALAPVGTTVGRYKGSKTVYKYDPVSDLASIDEIPQGGKSDMTSQYPQSRRALVTGGVVPQELLAVYRRESNDRVWVISLSLL